MGLGKDKLADRVSSAVTFHFGLVNICKIKRIDAPYDKLIFRTREIGKWDFSDIPVSFTPVDIEEFSAIAASSSSTSAAQYGGQTNNPPLPPPPPPGGEKELSEIRLQISNAEAELGLTTENKEELKHSEMNKDDLADCINLGRIVKGYGLCS